MIVMSSPRYLHNLLTRNRPVLWTWWRLIDKTVAEYEKRGR
jgi:hypothetical protein